MHGMGCGDVQGTVAGVPGRDKSEFERKGLGRPAGGGKSPVLEGLTLPDIPQVPPGTRNPAGIWEDHLPRLKTRWRPIADSTVRER